MAVITSPTISFRPVPKLTYSQGCSCNRPLVYTYSLKLCLEYLMCPVGLRPICVRYHGHGFSLKAWRPSCFGWKTSGTTRVSWLGARCSCARWSPTSITPTSGSGPPSVSSMTLASGSSSWGEAYGPSNPECLLMPM